MSEVTPIVLTDGTTPVTLNPISRSANETRFRAEGASIKLANPSLVYQYKLDGAVDRQTIRYTDPVVFTDTTTGEEYVKENCIANFSYRVPGVCSPAQRIEFIQRAHSVSLAAALQTELETGEGQW